MFERMGDASQRILDEFERGDVGLRDAVRWRARRPTPSARSSRRSPTRWVTCPTSATRPTTPSPTTSRGSEDLRSEAASALARARTRWEAHEDAVRALSSSGPATARRRRTSTPSRRPAATRRPTPTAPRRRTASSRASRRSTRRRAPLDSAADDLRASREEWGQPARRRERAQRPHRRPPRRHQPRRPVRPELVGVDPRFGVRTGDGPLGARRPARPGRRRSPAATGRRRCGRCASCSTACSWSSPSSPCSPRSARSCWPSWRSRWRSASPSTRRSGRARRPARRSASSMWPGRRRRARRRRRGRHRRAGSEGDERGDTAVWLRGDGRPDDAARTSAADDAIDVGDDLPEIAVSRGRHPESAQHVDDAQQAGHPAELTIDRAGANATSP